ncbi:MAG: PilT protein domain protein [Hydrocarboniphaga sp.]|uniref:type II toxin-antitoxin system VapC family toxin n=1 Tax=Hydrocarboniphaga sp. TaxID=2033016 RepID=UPI0026071314|nr:type II toxin-antitoxin system VapC family toxin [Hydrocarboniphaga sp.]MDB5970673.1 PilT protein domain protein [Hydrocarboniphaga sp.]
MRLLLDTHLVLWAMQDSRALSAAARAHLHGADAVFVSAASLWEMAIKASLGKLDVDSARLEQKLAEAGFQQLPVSWRHTLKLRELPPLHRDPFDRMLVAQAMSEPLRLLTHDSALVGYSELVTLV